MTKPTITQDKLKSVLSYNRITGIFTWIRASKFHPRMQGMIAGCKQLTRGKIYINIKIGGIGYRAHRLAFLYVHGYMPLEVDHKNGCSTDNWIKNLKDCTRFENTQNHIRRSRKNGLPTGVRVTSSGKYQSRISVNNVKINLGTFSTKNGANRAYIKARRKNHYHPATEY